MFTAEDGTRVTVREPLMADASKLVMFVNALVPEPRSGLNINKKINLKYERDWLRRRLREIGQRTVVTLYAEANKRIVGTCSIERRRHKEGHRAVLAVAVSEDHRGIGIGEMLVRQTIELAKVRMKGLAQIELAVITYNRRAMTLYKKLGFTKTGLTPRAIREGGEYFAEYQMALYLR